MDLVWPSRQYLSSYVAALERGWSPDNVRGQAASEEELERIARAYPIPRLGTALEVADVICFAASEAAR